MVGVSPVLRVSRDNLHCRVGLAGGHGGCLSKDVGRQESLCRVERLLEEDCLKNDGHEAEKKYSGELERFWLNLDDR
jgi:hypothetical protein